MILCIKILNYLGKFLYTRDSCIDDILDFGRFFCLLMKLHMCSDTLWTQRLNTSWRFTNICDRIILNKIICTGCDGHGTGIKPVDLMLEVLMTLKLSHDSLFTVDTFDSYITYLKIQNISQIYLLTLVKFNEINILPNNYFKKSCIYYLRK